MARRIDGGPLRPRWAVIVAVGIVLVVGLIAGSILLAGRLSGTPPARSPSPPLTSSHEPTSLPATASPEPSANRTSAPSARPTPSTSASNSPTGTPTATPLPSVSPTTIASIAPQSAANFDRQGQVIDIGFPLRSDTEYHYRDNFLDPRTGPPDPYNHARANPDGKLVRLHDGIDIYAPRGEPVLAPFDGFVIDPATKWSPWEPDRYGLTVVIESDEPTSGGYTAVLVHLEHVWVELGQHVSRGQVIGVLGETGNAENVRPQLHIELRAPFGIDWSPLGEDRTVDAFNPYPSLVQADPNN